jgi:hypothetical protein
MNRPVPEIVIVRSLQGSDLGIFAAHRASASSKQRAININSGIAARLLAPAVFESGGAVLDCICRIQEFEERSARHFGKIHKNWRLGGNKLEGQIFKDVDAVDFALIRSLEGNDGTAPISVTFISRALNPREHARLATLVAGQLKQSMTVIAESDPGFAEIDRGDTRLFDALRRIMCGSEREWLLRPGPDR